MKKKGAVELSMTTIIVIVIGVVLLSLALVWVRGVFSQLTETSDTAFEHGADAIDAISVGTSEPLEVSPSQVSVEQGKSKQVKVTINNLGESTATVKATAEAVSETGDPKHTCRFVESFQSESLEYELGSGQSLPLALEISIDSDAPLVSSGCTIRVEGLPDAIAPATVLITIES